MEIRIPINLGQWQSGQAEIFVGMLFSLLTPYLTALFTHQRMSDGAKIGASAFVSFLMAGLTVFLTGQTKTFSDVATAWSVMWPLSQTFYRNVALKLGVKAVEEATTPNWLKSDPPDVAEMTEEELQALLDRKRAAKVGTP